ncbi:EAL domain-containing protein [Azospirillum rugosum]|uniref:EAL domain-containing protein (Putative c-di-GMP-specific phosphodiesterase class I) n=1 Tax=Azospirillum rugosum TaxID=416170 RepID=A0ABS4SWI1_9PROT|nr:EAL domain-containing protein (putative c-di-GMP-specific phosphodiesterase class I) [Azospirillum rugosum]MDQ0530670.1 EAL domain-containing protein (putative c-di-GMP-specific phosphodiesterase class I) [Azospirillum rugosum]
MVSAKTGKGCGGLCAEGVGFDFTMAFQPIVDADTGTPWAHEALVRGPAGQGAGWVLGQVTNDTRYAFDQSCRVKAIELASRLGLRDAKLSINFLPNAVYEAETCIRATLAAAARTGFPPDRIIFEVTENERVVDRAHLQSIFTEYKRQGFLTAIDDFGSGYSGLNLLAEFQPDILKLDMELTRNIDADRTRRSIVAAILTVCRDLGITPVAEGVETAAEARALRDLGITLMQGYLFAKPALEALVPRTDTAYEPA